MNLRVLVVVLGIALIAAGAVCTWGDDIDPGKLTVHLAGHAHIDMNWLWLWPETIDVCKNTFSTAMNLMNEFPEFIFSQSQAVTYLAMQENHPDVFARIKEAVKKGQWEITASTWTEGDLNMSSGEAIVRSILYAKRYIREQFGFEPVVCWEPDTFGHPWTMPQILVKSGLKYYYHMRCSGPAPVHWWQGPDGSKVLAYSFGSYGSDISEKDVLHDALSFARAAGINDYMRVYGVGDHGGGPTRAMLQEALRLRTLNNYPKIKFSTVQAYFDLVSAQANKFPVHNGELNTVFEGCYTTHADIKRWNRECENVIPCAEKLAVIASEFGAQYPFKEFEKSWRNTCFNQFHDLLCGSAIHDSYKMCRELYEQAISQAKDTIDHSLDILMSRISTDGPGVPIVVFNPLSWTRTDVVEVPSPFAGEDVSVRITDETGRVCAGQNVGDRLVFTARDVPSLGYKVFWANRAHDDMKTSVKCSGSTVENEFFRLRIDPVSGTIAELYDKVNKRSVFASGAKAGILQVLWEEPHGMSAWNIGKIQKTEDIARASAVRAVCNGPVRAAVAAVHDFNKSRFTQEIMLHDGVPRVDIKLTADWQEVGTNKAPSPMIKVAFPVGLSQPRAAFEIPFGCIERPTNGAEVPAQKWIDLSDERYGVGLLNNCKYGFDVNRNVMRMSLLRCSYDPDPVPDVGVHEVVYSIYPHKGDWNAGNTVRRGYELNEPLIARVTEKHSGALPKSKSFVWVSEPNIVVTALKRSENGRGTILRFYETQGKECQAKIAVGFDADLAVETDLMERPVGVPIKLRDGRFTVKVGKYEIKTFELTSKEKS
ncbi:MAG: glycoside hydrolase family 38 C-terminal domain-containing protein [Armatimonadota bacterium]|nr:glycoside hydrolase family 38 C-terminal domain-containing protein [Armatimonadota bacterium]